MSQAREVARIAIGPKTPKRASSDERQHSQDKGSEGGPGAPQSKENIQGRTRTYRQTDTHTEELV